MNQDDINYYPGYQGRNKTMKKKIIGMFVCILMIASAVPAVKAVKNNVINSTVPSTPITTSVVNWTETQKLLASDGAAGDLFGRYVSLDGDTALISAYADDDNGVDSGSVYVFTHTGNTWTLQQKLHASDAAAGDCFGTSVSLNGDTALVGECYQDENRGSAYVFTRTGTTWTQQAKLLASDGAAGDMFGFEVSLSGNTAIIGANGDDGYRGSAYVFIRTGTTWTQQQKLTAPDGAPGDKFGLSPSLDGDTALIGAYAADNYMGSAYVFTRTGTTWTLQQKLLASDGVWGDLFGCNVALSGDTALIGACYQNGNTGSAYVFTRTGTTWTQQTKLLASDGVWGDYFGYSVSINGDTALIGSLADSAYIFTRTGTTWLQQQKLTDLGGAAGDSFGFSVSLSGDTALIGANAADSSKGAAYMFTKIVLTFNTAGGLGVNLKITNNGTTDATGVPWQIHVEGGYLGQIDKTVNGIIAIPAGKSVTLTTGMLFGFGAISITAKVANGEQTATGTQLIIFSIVNR